MYPAEHTRVVLAEFQCVGVPFKTAWAAAMRTLPRKQPEYAEWKHALSWARPAYEACYLNNSFEVLHPDDEHSELVCIHAPTPVHAADTTILIEDALAS